MKKYSLLFSILLLTILSSAQNVGIGTTAPIARLHVSDSNVVFTGALFLPGSPGNPPISGPGARMMWYPDKAAFRTGYVSGPDWDKDSIGTYSFASGYNGKAKGQFATSLGYQTSATGNFSTAMGFMSVASGDNSISTGVQTRSSGSQSTAMGAQTISSGTGAFALGYSTIASGIYSMAMGYGNTASGESSTVMGAFNTAGGSFSTAMGISTIAKGFSSTVLGRYNDSILTINESFISPLTPLFIIGNGDGNSTRRNAITVLNNGNAGIGLSAPIARLHVSDSNVVFTGPNNVLATTAFAPPIQGPGSRLMWYPQKAALRAGLAFGNQWDKDSIGIMSIALGNSTKAKGESSFASGAGTNASGLRSTAMGEFTTASGQGSFSAGIGTISGGTGSVALGYFASTNGSYSFAAGSSSNASAANSTAIGTENLASGMFSVSLGIHSVSSGNSAIALGDSSIASGTQSIAAGSYVTSKSRASFATGWNNDNTDNPDPNFVSPTDRIFQVGNGNGFLATRSNALTILRNANMGIGIINPRFPLSFNNNSGDKISLYDDGNPSQLHFGIGMFSGQLMQVHAATLLDDIAFGYGNSASFTERMRIKGNGNVGIGTTTPLARLHVYDSSVVFTGPVTLPATPGNPPVSGTGTRLMWYADKGAFRAGSVSSTQWDKDNIGIHSFASGVGSIASGNSSVSLGSFNISSGDYTFTAGNGNSALALVSTAFGNSTTASAPASMSMGDNTIASGYFSTVMGRYTKARSDFSLVTGIYNDTTALNRLFEIGNGTADNARNNALTILSNGTALFTAPATLPVTPGATPVSGAGNRMMWYADKASFRAGNVTNTSWDKDNIGNVSFAVGSNTQASGIISNAMGNFAFATGDISTAIGNSVFAKAKMSFTTGTYNDITDAPNASVEAPGDRLFQVGNGSGNLARSNALTILRNGNLGIGTLNPSKQTEVVGAASAVPVTLLIGNRGGFGPVAMEFVSDYGTPNQWRPGYIRSNDAGGFTGMVEIYTNGTGSGNLNGSIKGFEVRNGAAYTASGTVNSFSDARIKTNVHPFTDGLDVISKINPVSFNYTTLSPFNTDKQQVGIIAQELESIAPYMIDKITTKDFEDLRSVNNQAYTFLLINAVKELATQKDKQQDQIEILQKQLDEKQQQIDDLKKIMMQIINKQ